VAEALDGLTGKLSELGGDRILEQRDLRQRR
jgi:hypothetical protein